MCIADGSTVAGILRILGLLFAAADLLGAWIW